MSKEQKAPPERITDKAIEDAFEGRFDGIEACEIVRELLTAEQQLAEAKGKVDCQYEDLLDRLRNDIWKLKQQLAAKTKKIASVREALEIDKRTAYDIGVKEGSAAKDKEIAALKKVIADA